jgi:hypothetical protein
MFEKLRKSKKLAKAKKMFLESVSKDSGWQRKAIGWFAFRDGEQWTKEERSILEAEMRPVLTFNLTKSHIDLIMGMNEDNRIIHRAIPVDPTDAFLAEVLNDLTEWVRENNDFTAEEDAALESASICGRGYVAIDIWPDPDNFGEIIISEIAVPVHEVHFDQAARRPGLEDAAFICWDRWLTKDDFKIRYPKVTSVKLAELLSVGREGGFDESMTGIAKGASQSAFEIPPEDDDTDNDDYSTPLDVNFYDRARDMIRVVHMEYWDVYKRYFVYNPEEGRFIEVDSNPTKAQKAVFFEQFGEEMTVETMMDKRVKWIQFSGNEILFDGPSPIPHKGFSIVPMFAYRDVSQRSMNHFGLVKLIEDPQKEVNKRWSQTLNLLNNQVQPGVFAETDAFVDEMQATASMKEAGGITWVNAGALTGGKIQPRDVPAFPNAPMQMEQHSQEILKKVTGVNPDLLGQDRGRKDAGVVIRMRQQQGIMLLKPLFRSYNEMKKQLFKRQLALIMEFMPDEQILKVLGQTERYIIDPESGAITDKMTEMTADIRDVTNLRYNIAAESAPGNMAKRMLELQILLEMGSQLPVPPEMVIEKLDISATEKIRWLEYINQQQQSQTELQMAMMEKEVEFKEREVADKEQNTMLDFMVDMAKIKQMVEKDEKKLVTDFEKLGVEEKEAILQYMVGMAGVAQQASAAATAAKQGGESGKKKQGQPSKPRKA